MRMQYGLDMCVRGDAEERQRGGGGCRCVEGVKELLVSPYS